MREGIRIWRTETYIDRQQRQFASRKTARWKGETDEKPVTNLPRLPLICCMLIFWVVPIPAHAGLVDFNGNPINFTMPSVVEGTATVTSTTPTLMKLDKGYSILDLEYTITDTSANNDNIVVQWTSERTFDHSALQDVRVTISGNTNATFDTGAQSSGRFFVIAGIDTLLAVNHIDIFSPSDPISPWNKTGVVMDVSAGSHDLEMRSGVTWFFSAMNEKLTISSRYAVIAVPEPASFPLLGIGLGLLGYILRMKRRAIN